MIIDSTTTASSWTGGAQMKYLGSVAALLGLLIAGWLIWRDDPAVILHLLESAGAGLLLAALVHIFPMLPNAGTGAC